MTAVGTPEGAFDAQNPSLEPSFLGEDGLNEGSEEENSRLSESEAGSMQEAPGSLQTHRESLIGTEFQENPVSIVARECLGAMGEAAQARGYMWVELARPGPQYRGRLGLYVEECIEQHLEDRGALPPGIHASTGLDASLSDQLYRARLVEMHGIALGIPSLEGITNLGRALDAEDSAVLRWWMAAAADRPVRLVVSEENTRLRVYPSPVLFESLFEVAPGPVTPMPPAPSMAESSKTMELSDLPPEVHETNVFGTEIEAKEVSFGYSFEGQTSSYSAPYSAPDAYESEYDSAEYGHDVELPDLDRALGLVDAAQGDAVQVDAAPCESSPQPHAPVQAVQAALHEGFGPEIHDAETVIPRGDFRSASELDADAESAERNLAQSASFEPAVFNPAVFKPADDDDLGDLDADEFLRTLKEDSSRAPEVVPPLVSPEPVRAVAAPADLAPPLEPSPAESLADSAEEPETSEKAPQEPSDLSPLPTKKITRNPFIRLAEFEAENVPAALSAASDQESEKLDEKTADLRASSADLGTSDSLEAGDAPRTTSVISEPDMTDPFNQLAEREWKQWVKNLKAARGPKPLSVIERMFVTDYTRLREAVRRGVAEESATPILDEWQSSFEKSYREAFDALRMRGKRPSMVLDLPELATRLARLQGAKHVQFLLVDGLRFDLGLMVQDRMRNTVDAALTERLLLWSALPSNTTYQIELLGKGPDGLKEPGGSDEDSPALVARGRSARVPRRVRTGSLELLKLDVVEDELRQAGAPVMDRMEAIADETARAIVAHINKQAPRTMVIVFGDHGFSLDPSRAGTTEEVTQGGASPEEILVPAFAWLTGATH